MHQARQRSRVGQGQASRHRHRAARSAGDDRDVEGRQALVRQEEELLQRVGVVLQARRHVDVAGREGPLAQCVGAAGDGLRHLDHLGAARHLVGDEDDGLHGVPEHRLELEAVGELRRHVRRQEHGHREVDERERVAEPGGLGDVLEHRAPPLAGAMVDDVEAIGAGPEVRPGAFERHHRAAQPVVEDDPPRDRGQGALHQARRDPDPISLRHGRAGLPRELDGLGLEEAHARALEDLQARVVESLALSRRQPRKRRPAPTRARRSVIHLESPRAVCGMPSRGNWCD